MVHKPGFTKRRKRPIGDRILDCLQKNVNIIEKRGREMSGIK